jgi:hypothetical protein
MHYWTFNDMQKLESNIPRDILLDQVFSILSKRVLCNLDGDLDPTAFYRHDPISYFIRS